jgi:hypothetical protein
MSKEKEYESEELIKKYIIGQRDQAKNYFQFSSQWIAVTLTILTLLWTLDSSIPSVSYLLLIAFLCFVNNVAVNSKIIHEIDEGQFRDLEDINPWVSFAEYSYGFASTLVLTAFMIIFYAASDEDLIAPTVFLAVAWGLYGIYASVRNKVNRRKVRVDFAKIQKKTLFFKVLTYMIEIGFYALLVIDKLGFWNWILPLTPI